MASETTTVYTVQKMHPTVVDEKHALDVLTVVETLLTVKNGAVG